MASMAMALLTHHKPLLPPPPPSSPSYSTITKASTFCNCRRPFIVVHCCSNTLNLRFRRHIVRMAPEEEKMTRRSPLDFPIEWERPRPGRRPDIFPQFSPMKTPLPPPLPADPPEEDEEEEEKKEEQPEEDPGEEETDKPEQQ